MLSVFTDPAQQIIRHANIKRAVPPGCEDVNEV